MASIPLKIGMVYKGAYSPMTTYDLWNTVQHEGSLYAFIALTPASGKPLPVWPEVITDYWMLSARRGSHVEQRLTSTHIQWRLEDGEWQDLMSIETMTAASATAVDAADVATQMKAAAETAATQAAGFKADAETAATQAAGSKSDAETAATQAAGSKTAAETAAAQASASEIAAAGSKTAAQEAALGLANPTVEVTTLAPGTDGTGDWDTSTGTPKLKLGIPRGYDGTGTGDMLASVYDTNADGIVNRADKADALTNGASSLIMPDGKSLAEKAAEWDSADPLPDNVMLYVEDSGEAPNIPNVDADLINGLAPSHYLDRTNHTGVQGIETVSGLQSALDGKAVVSTYATTIPATGWTGTEAPYTIEIAVAGILATDNPIADIVQTGTWSTDEVIREDWGKIARITTADGVITVYASELPTAEIPIQIKVVR